MTPTSNKNEFVDRFNEKVEILSSKRSTVFDHLDRMMRLEMIKSFSRSTNSTGRPLVFFKLREGIEKNEPLFHYRILVIF